MIQDIEPKTFDNQFKSRKAQLSDLFLSYDCDKVLVREDKNKLWYPSFLDFERSFPKLRDKSQFLFAIDDITYYLVEEKGLDNLDGWAYVSTSRFRTEPKYWRSFAGVVGWQLNRWYKNNKYCGRCGKPTKPSSKERALICEDCGYQIYPIIYPCVIVAVYDKDRLLLTKYKGRPYTNFALIAGFVEIGESFEDAVKREVMEEAGLKIKNIRFYKSQPWPFTDTVIAGFYAELDGDNTITLQEEELSLAVWMNKKDIPADELKISLTGEMMDAFRMGIF